MQQFDYTIKAIETAAKSPKGLIRIASIPSVAGRVFPQAIETLTRRNPGLNLELRDTDTRQVIDALLKGQVDIGIVSSKHRLNGIRQAALFRDRFGLICAPDHPLARQSQTPTMDDLTSSAFIRNNLCNLIETPAFQTAIADSNVSIQNKMSLIAMVRTGRWVTVLPKTVVQFMSNDLVFRQIDDLPDQRDVTLLMRKRVSFPSICEEFWQHLVQFDWAS